MAPHAQGAPWTAGEGPLPGSLQHPPPPPPPPSDPPQPPGPLAPPPGRAESGGTVGLQGARHQIERPRALAAAGVPSTPVAVRVAPHVSTVSSPLQPPIALDMAAEQDDYQWRGTIPHQLPTGEAPSACTRVLYCTGLDCTALHCTTQLWRCISYAATVKA